MSPRLTHSSRLLILGSPAGSSRTGGGSGEGCELALSGCSDCMCRGWSAGGEEEAECAEPHPCSCSAACLPSPGQTGPHAARARGGRRRLDGRVSWRWLWRLREGCGGLCHACPVELLLLRDTGRRATSGGREFAELKRAERRTCLMSAGVSVQPCTPLSGAILPRRTGMRQSASACPSHNSKMRTMYRVAGASDSPHALIPTAHPLPHDHTHRPLFSAPHRPRGKGGGLPD
jgi:hypothetical protein